jgi:poly-gamma-glutamate system protein
MKITESRSNPRLFFGQIYLSSAVSVAFFLLLLINTGTKTDMKTPSVILQSSTKMMCAIKEIRKYFIQNKILFNLKRDPNRTGLIGDRNSGLTTTLGNLEAKRTTTNPNFSGLIVGLILQTGIKSDQTIVINSSASFPALMIAALSAAESLNLNILLHLSFGSSSYGANNPDFNILRILTLLNRKNILKTRPLSISIGGDHDVGLELSKNVRKEILLEIKESKIRFIYQPDLRKNIHERMKIFDAHSLSSKISLFINIGGSYSSLGTSSKVLLLKPGLNYQSSMPSVKQRGLLFEMISRKVPCLHLLFIKGLSAKYNLPWDPIPLPAPTSAEIPSLDKKLSSFEIISALVYLLIIFLIWGDRVLRWSTYRNILREKKS